MKKMKKSNVKHKSFSGCNIYCYCFFLQIDESQGTLTIALVAGYLVPRETFAVISWRRVDTLGIRRTIRTTSNTLINICNKEELSTRKSTDGISSRSRISRRRQYIGQCQPIIRPKSPESCLRIKKIVQRSGALQKLVDVDPPVEIIEFDIIVSIIIKFSDTRRNTIIMNNF